VEKEKIIAFCYDFDKTLTPDDMQSQGFIQSLGATPYDFWEETAKTTIKGNMDSNLSYMYMMLKKYNERSGPLTREELKSYGVGLRFFPGVMNWFLLINRFAETLGVKVEHYVISSGIKEMIEGCAIAKFFKKIYASSFYYESNIAVWPAMVVNYTNKTQFLFRISKGYLDETDERVNDSISPENYRIPFKRIIYLGDSVTDIPCMKVVTSYGGYSLGIYDSELSNSKRVERMLQEKRICNFFQSDYRENSPLFQACCDIIKKIKEDD
jgi:2-hydroxy-3-keto-5-methylthiopentenyl-1-phosphate phosphatase